MDIAFLQKLIVVQLTKKCITTARKSKGVEKGDRRRERRR
jgi:hypothetical protein